MSQKKGILAGIRSSDHVYLTVTECIHGFLFFGGAGEKTNITVVLLSYLIPALCSVETCKQRKFEGGRDAIVIARCPVFNALPNHQVHLERCFYCIYFKILLLLGFFFFLKKNFLGLLDSQVAQRAQSASCP